MKVVLKIFTWDHRLINMDEKSYKTKADANRRINDQIGYFVRLAGYGRQINCDETLNKIILTITSLNKKDTVYYEFELIED